MSLVPGMSSFSHLMSITDTQPRPGPPQVYAGNQPQCSLSQRAPCFQVKRSQINPSLLLIWLTLTPNKHLRVAHVSRLSQSIIPLPSAFSWGHRHDSHIPARPKTSKEMCERISAERIRAVKEPDRSSGSLCFRNVFVNNCMLNRENKKRKTPCKMSKLLWLLLFVSDQWKISIVNVHI